MTLENSTAFDYGNDTRSDTKTTIVKGISPIFPNEDSHDRLLEYLERRLKVENVTRPARLMRYMRIDRFISTWQRLSNEDSQRATKQEMDGVPQAISINLPVIHTHVDDMVAFFCAVFAPSSGNFFANPDKSMQASVQELMDKLNGDAKIHKYFKNLGKMIRSLLKYNMGGFSVEWVSRADPFRADPTEQTEGANKATALDLYNFMWDQSVPDPADIRTDAEWTAQVYYRNRKWLIDRQDRGTYQGLEKIIDEHSQLNNGAQALYYKHPPYAAGLNSRDTKTAVGNNATVDWTRYGASLQSDSTTEINGHEIVVMYCWLNPSQFGLISKPGERTDAVENSVTYQLWRFEIVDMRVIATGAPVQAETNVGSDTAGETRVPEIPIYAGFLNQDDMGVAQRSVAELLQPFQTYGSFLLNSNVIGTRASTYGVQIYDPSGVDMTTIPEGEVVARIPSKQPGRDVRSMISDFRPAQDVKTPLDSLQVLLSLVKEFFPAQAMPSQVAGIDRAIQSQVASVLQGINRRLHMLVRLIDSDILQPSRFALYLNIARAGQVQLAGVTDETAAKVMGSGLAQLNREIAEQGMRQLLLTLIQNPNTAQGIDILGLINYWSSMLDISTDLSQFAKQPAPAAPAPGPTPGEAPAGAVPPVVPGQ